MLQAGGKHFRAQLLLGVVSAVDERVGVDHLKRHRDRQRALKAPLIHRRDYA